MYSSKNTIKHSARYFLRLLSILGGQYGFKFPAFELEKRKPFCNWRWNSDLPNPVVVDQLRVTQNFWMSKWKNSRFDVGRGEILRARDHGSHGYIIWLSNFDFEWGLEYEKSLPSISAAFVKIDKKPNYIPKGKECLFNPSPV